MTQALSPTALHRENLAYAGTRGISQNNRSAGFRAAFCDTRTGRAEIARFANGAPSPIHVLDGVPDEWVLDRSASGSVTALKASIVAGFLLDDRFYTREEAANALM